MRVPISLWRGVGGGNTMRPSPNYLLVWNFIAIIVGVKCVDDGVRYMVKVSDEHLATIQLSTSKPDVRLKLSILDNEEEVASSEGKGQAVLPVFVFLPNSSSEVNAAVQSTSFSCKQSTDLLAVFTTIRALNR